jgi:transposase
MDAVASFDLRPFRQKYRSDGRGHPAYNPEMMVTLLIYAYSMGERSSRRIEKLCERDIAFRCLTGNQKPDHSVICRFRQEFENEIGDLFIDVLKLCREAKLTKAGVIAIDGTKMAGNASLAANRTKEKLQEEVTKILTEAKLQDEKENAKYGVQRGDELPKEMRDPKSRLSRINECKERLNEKEKADEKAREELLAKRKEREEAGERLRGRKPKENQKPKEPKANPTDPESRIMKTGKRFLQGYNAQAVANQYQIILAAEVTQDENDQKQLYPMLTKTCANLKAIGQSSKLKIALADKGYSPEISNPKPVPGNAELFIPPQQKAPVAEKQSPRGRIPAKLSNAERMRRKLKTKRGANLYKQRGQLIEPVFGQIKSGRRLNQFSRRGKDACASEWKLMCAVHNLGKLWKRKQNGRKSQ